MKVRLIKEIRELFPVLAVTLAVIALPLLGLGAQAEAFTFVGVLLGCAAMGGISFGAEFQRKTLSVLLSQPVTRRVIWMEKMLVLGGALGAVTAAALLLRLSVFHSGNDDILGILIVPACAFAGAPFLTLLTRNGLAGGVFAMALPGALLAFLAAVLPGSWFVDQSLSGINLGAAIMLVCVALYCVAAFALGFSYFCSMQVIEGAGGTELALPALVEKWLSKRRRPPSAGAVTVPEPTLALFRKELRLQQISFLTAAVFVLLAMAGMLVKWTRPEAPWAEWIVASNFVIYLCILPLLVGALAYAEERSWGISEWHLTLPASARSQWFTKFATTLPASFFLGLLLPGALVYLATNDAFPSSPSLLLVCLGQLLLMTLAAYAGSFSSSSLKAILFPVAIVGAGALVAKLVTVVWLFVGEHQMRSLIVHPWFPQWAYAAACIVVLLCLFQWFCFSSFRRGGHGTKRVLGELVLALTVVGVMVALFWERYTA